MQFKWMSPIIVVLAFVMAVGMVAAQDDAEATPEATTEATTATTTNNPRPFGMHHDGMRGFGMDIVSLTDATGLTADEIRTALADGSTIAELIQANGGDVDALIANAVEEDQAYLDVAVQYDRLTQEEADAEVAQFEETLTARVNGELDAPFRDGLGGRDGFGMRGGFGFDLTSLTDATGLTADEIRTAVADGSTIAELVEANGGDLNALIAEAVATHQERLTTAVENGRLTQEEAD
ncbi:MAG: hypothetical protein KC496_15945, partial [Anaerolineae bacterium]|nr:hypothetical protein [Anaerolineae bacterium]